MSSGLVVKVIPCSVSGKEIAFHIYNWFEFRILLLLERFHYQS